MTITELSNLVGKQCDWRPVVTGACTVQAIIQDARSSYGRTDVYVEPICGKGGVWVRLASVSLEGRNDVSA